MPQVVDAKHAKVLGALIGLRSAALLLREAVVAEMGRKQFDLEVIVGELKPTGPAHNYGGDPAEAITRDVKASINDLNGRVIEHAEGHLTLIESELVECGAAPEQVRWAKKVDDLNDQMDDLFITIADSWEPFFDAATFEPRDDSWKRQAPLEYCPFEDRFEIAVEQLPHDEGDDDCGTFAVAA
jgi:hypothetical protein